MNAAAYDSMTWILARWSRLGGSQDSEFILPHRPRTVKGLWILDEPMTAITTAFGRIRKEAGLPTFRVYDCRVQAITKLLSNPTVSSQTSKEIAGHISQAMQDRYSIQQHDTKMAALEALEHPTSRPETEPTPPAQPSTSADLMHATIRAEIDCLKAEVARLREHPPAPSAPETHARRKPRTEKPADDHAAVIFRRNQSTKNVITFPTRSAYAVVETRKKEQ